MQEFDNISHKLGDDLKQTLTQGSKVMMTGSKFSLYAYQALQANLNEIDSFQFIFSPAKLENHFANDFKTKTAREFYIPQAEDCEIYNAEMEIKLKNQLEQKAIAKECANWIKEKACFKTNLSEKNIPNFLNIINSEQGATYTGVDEFTTADLGYSKSNDWYAISKTELSSQKQNLFKNLWSNKSYLEDVTSKVLASLTEVYQENAPDYIYALTLYHLFHKVLDDYNNDFLPNEATGFKNSQVWQKLFSFQKDAVLAIINKLEKYNGCILADSVGLGKTFTSLAVIKYYEQRNKSVLVLCPKKLYDNWNTYKQNYVHNPLNADRLRFDILFHSDLYRTKGTSNGLELSQINWGNYDLVVIDESHNFRNGEGTKKDGQNRYKNLMDKVIKAGVKTKVLMLSATPVNNRFRDLKNQLELAYEGDAEQINNLLDTNLDINQIFIKADSAFKKWSQEDLDSRSTQSLLDSLPNDFFKVLDAVTIARSRRHIERFYADADIGKFPERLPPINRNPELADFDGVISYQEIYELLQRLKLAIYEPSKYVHPSRRYKYETEETFKGEGLGRERGSLKLISMNLLKRLESSVDSFRETLSRMQQFIDETLAKIQAFEEKQQNSVLPNYEIGILDPDDNERAEWIGKGKNPIELADMDYESWRVEILQDLETIQLLQAMIADITPERDLKLVQLLADIRGKISQPINPHNQKVLIFTAFADTAEYLYREVAKACPDLRIGLVSGGSEKHNLAGIKNLSLQELLTFFSPISKDKAKIYPNQNAEIDILIATDCISEGQNLQDCDYLINYDIHWNPVRIIQRFGRIDRIGSHNSKIQLVNYWPHVELDEYIKLQTRVEARMHIANLSGAGNDNLLEANEEAQYRLRQLERLQAEVLDLEDMGQGVSITDLTLETFRQDLLQYLQSYPQLTKAPKGLHSLLEQSCAELEQANLQISSKPVQSVIFLLKQLHPDAKPSHDLHPYYLLHLDGEGNLLEPYTSPKASLDLLRNLARGKTKPEAKLCQIFNTQTQDGKKMEEYSKLLNQALNAILTKKEEKAIDSLFSQGVTTSTLSQAESEDFELITFFVIY